MALKLLSKLKIGALDGLTYATRTQAVEMWKVETIEEMSISR